MGTIKRIALLAIIVAAAFVAGRTSMRDARVPAPEDHARLEAWLMGLESSRGASPAVLRIYEMDDLMNHIVAAYRREISKPPPITKTYTFGRDPAVPEPNLTLADHQQQFARLFEDTVMPETWRDNGGAVGWIKFIGGRMYVWQTPEAQAGIADALQVLRARWIPNDASIKAIRIDEPSNPF
jgi:hypothetical protein